MEINGKPGRIQISANTKTILELTEAEGYAIKSRGRISVKVLSIWRFLCLFLLWAQNDFGPSKSFWSSTNHFGCGPICFGQVQIRLLWTNFYDLGLSKIVWTQPK